MPNQKPPCSAGPDHCPKHSPQRFEKELRLQPANRETFELFLLAREMAFNNLTDAEKFDPIVSINFRIIGSILRKYSKKDEAMLLAHVIEATRPRF